MRHKNITFQFNLRNLLHSANVILLLSDSDRQGPSLNATNISGQCGWHLKLDEHYVRFQLNKSGMEQARAVVTPGSKDASTAARESTWTRKAYKSIAR